MIISQAKDKMSTNHVPIFSLLFSFHLPVYLIKLFINFVFIFLTMMIPNGHSLEIGFFKRY